MIYALLVLVIIAIGYYMSGRLGIVGKLFRDGFSDLNPCLIFVVTICCSIVIVGSINYVFSIGNIAEMEAFYDNTLSVYKYTVDKSEDITIYAVKDAENEMNMLFNAGNLAYFELAKSVNSNLVELRESIETYNTRLYSYRRYNDFWFTDSCIANVPERLKAIKIK